VEEMSEEATVSIAAIVAENADVLEYFEQATPVHELDAARIGSRLRAAAKAAVSKICAPFRGCLDGCRAVMQFCLVWGWPGLQSFAKKGRSTSACCAKC